MTTLHVTRQPWAHNLQHEKYATDDTYRLACEWLTGCRSVADWGGGMGYASRYLPPGVTYVCIDGTAQGPKTLLADLTQYRAPSDGIILRHVLDQSEEWADILENAMLSFQERMVVVTFTPDADTTHRHKVKSGWPVMHFHPDDLRRAMRPYLVTDRKVRTTHPERMYYLEKRA